MCSKILGQILTAIVLETIQETEDQQRQQTKCRKFNKCFILHFNNSVGLGLTNELHLNPKSC